MMPQTFLFPALLRAKSIFSLRGRLGVLLLACLWLGHCPVALAQEKRGLDGLEMKPFAALSDRYVSRLGEQALSIDPGTWEHAESENFIYHCQSGPAATAASVEAEFYYRVIATDLKKDSSHWQRKAHIFIFENADQWHQFQSVGGLDPWTGGLNAGNELFLLRDSADRWKGRTLGHEIAHLVVNRFFTGFVPRWLNEGYAENISRRAYASFYRARGFNARPVLDLVKPEDFIPLDRLMNMQSYPTETKEIMTFYVESDRLVRYLVERGKDQFITFFSALASGATNDSALSSAYGSQFSGVQDLDEKFRVFAAKNYTTQTVEP